MDFLRLKFERKNRMEGNCKEGSGLERKDIKPENC